MTDREELLAKQAKGMESTLVKSQRLTFGPKFYAERGRTLRIIATVRHDDECGNGHNTFSITAEIHEKCSNGMWREYSGGCLHDEVANHFPELAPLIKWHLCSTDGPLHYVSNTLYLAGDRDCWGLRKGEFRQLVNRKTGKPSWTLDEDSKLERYINADECPAPVVLQYKPWGRTGEGKDRELDAARRAAIWPEATDTELCADDLKERLEARLPKLMEQFKAAVESLGMTY